MYVPSFSCLCLATLCGGQKESCPPFLWLMMKVSPQYAISTCDFHISHFIFYENTRIDICKRGHIGSSSSEVQSYNLFIPPGAIQVRLQTQFC